MRVLITGATGFVGSHNFCAINLRPGLFAGSHYALGLLPILAPRLKTHLVPWEPLVTHSIIHLLEESGANSERATRLLGYQPRHHWWETVDIQMAGMARQQNKSMSMARPLPGGGSQ